MTGVKIKELRDRMGLSQKALGDAIGVHRVTILNWENNKSAPNADELQRLAKFFKVSVDDLVGKPPEDWQGKYYELLERYTRILEGREVTPKKNNPVASSTP